MGTSITTTVVYGWLLTYDEYRERPIEPWPWAPSEEEQEEYEDGEGWMDPEDWWLKLTGFDHPYPYGEDGNYLPGMSREVEGTAWADARLDWLAEHPIPIELVWSGSGEYLLPRVIRPVGAQFEDNSRDGDPCPMPDIASVEDWQEAVKAASAFIEEHGIGVTGHIGLYALSSYT